LPFCSTLLNLFFIFRAFEIGGQEQKETENKPQVRCTIRIVKCKVPASVLRIQIRRIHMLLGLLDPETIVGGVDPDPSIINQK
jgi:hypothetical protein